MVREGMGCGKRAASPAARCVAGRRDGGALRARSRGEDYCAWSRFAAIFDDMPKISMKPFDMDWSNVSPLSYVARLKS